MEIRNYIKALFSERRFYKDVSFLALWDSKTQFSKKVLIGAFSRLHNANVGDYTRIKPLCNIFNAQIGKYCSIAKGVKIGLGKHPTHLLSTNSVFYKSGIRTDWFKEIDYCEEERVLIGNDVWIGLEAVIMDGVKVGDGAIIGARTVVTKDVPPYSIVVGVPAKVVKYRFDNQIIDKLLTVKWWDLTEDEICYKLDIFTSNHLTIGLLNQYFTDENI